MQEEVNQKTVALSIRTTKLTGKVLAAALGKVVRALQKHHQKALTPQGRQSVKKLMNHYGGKSAMPYVGAPKDFDRIAKEFHVDYAFHKVSPGHYLLFFNAANMGNGNTRQTVDFYYQADSESTDLNARRHYTHSRQRHSARRYHFTVACQYRAE